MFSSQSAKGEKRNGAAYIRSVSFRVGWRFAKVYIVEGTVNDRISSRKYRCGRKRNVIAYIISCIQTMPRAQSAC